jgi:hypothetical protein
MRDIMENENKDSKIIKQLSETVGLPKELVNKAISFLGEILGPSARESGLILHDFVKQFRFKRQIKILSNVKQYCQEHNISPTTVALKNIVPLLELSSLEEDNSLFELWTNLLIHAVDPKNNQDQMNSYIDTLKQLSKKEVLFLNFIYHEVNYDLVPYFNIEDVNFLESLFEATRIEKKDLKLVYTSTKRLGLVDYYIEDMWINDLNSALQSVAQAEMSDLDYGSRHWSFINEFISQFGNSNFSSNYEWCSLTSFGFSFMDACTKK